MNTEIAIPFFLKTIQMEQFAWFEENFKEDDSGAVELTTQIQFKLNPQNQIVSNFVGVTFQQQQKTFLKINMSCFFKIKEPILKELMDETHSKIVLPKHFLQHLVVITIGTIRGVLFAKTEGTVFNRFIIPTLDVTNLVRSDEVFLISEVL
jgi:ABC-type cobalamin transport system permease subunit